jgi:hypothetical protein
VQGVFDENGRINFGGIVASMEIGMVWFFVGSTRRI